MEFIRWGNLTPQFHKIELDDSCLSYHAPPVPVGFYAFPKGFIEDFLIGGIGGGSTQNGRYRTFKNPETKKPYKISINDYFEFYHKILKHHGGYRKKRSVGLEVSQEVDNEEYYDNIFSIITNDKEKYLRWINNYSEDFKNKPRRVLIENDPRHFNYNGLIWHHLYKESKDKLSHLYIKKIRSWVLTDIKTYEKCVQREIASLKYQSKYYGWGSGKWIKPDKDYGDYGGSPLSFYSKDHFEVYIESIQNDNKNIKR